MGKRVHIVGISPRTGTTLMYELMINCFELSDSGGHEFSIFEKAPRDSELFCSKDPGDSQVIPALLRIDPKLWVINMLRDPRDIIVSRHGKAPDRYWSNLRIWKTQLPAVREAQKHPRFVNVRYEDLVKTPEQVQTLLMERMPFLKKKADFRDYYHSSRPPGNTLEALGELRPIDTRSVGAWQEHLPRVAAQIAIHGSIDAELVEFGYERDESWHEVMQGVVPDNGRGFFPDRLSGWQRLRRSLRRQRKVRRYARDIARGLR